MTGDQERVLFICWHNSARSQMAEGLLRELGGDRFQVFSAGIEASVVRSEAVDAMREIGVDISNQQSKTFERYRDQPFDWLITVCDSARQACPVFLGADRTLHWNIEDPAAVTGSEDERLSAFRRARDDLRGRIRAFLLTAGHDRAADSVDLARSDAGAPPGG